MKDTIDLTVGRDFRDPGPNYTPRIPWPNPTHGYILRGDPILRKLGYRIFSGQDQEFPPKDRCEFCGRSIPPWGNESGLCKGCDQEVETPVYLPWGREEMKEDTRILS